MPVGFPAKTTYANGDVFSASDINDTNGTLNLVNPATTPTVQANPVLNSAMQIWQRGTSIAIAASTNAWTADRYNTATNANQASTISRQATNDTTNLPFIQYCQRIQRNSGQTGVLGLNTSNFFENVNSTPFIGKTVTFSFYARAGANFSASGNSLDFYLQTGTGTDQGVGGWTGQTSPIVGSATLTTTWQRFSATGTIATSATQIKVVTAWTPTGTASTNDYYEVTGLQVDIGSVALPFRTYAGTIQGELAACQRYYFRTASTGANSVIGTGIGASTTAFRFAIPTPVPLRTNPTSVDTSALQGYDQVNLFALTSPSLEASFQSPNMCEITYNSTSITQFRPYWLITSSASGYIGFSAEL